MVGRSCLIVGFFSGVALDVSSDGFWRMRFNWGLMVWDLGVGFDGFQGIWTWVSGILGIDRDGWWIDGGKMRWNIYG